MTSRKVKITKNTFKFVKAKKSGGKRKSTSTPRKKR